MITDVPGVRVGHWTDRGARTGCTVVRFPEGTVASGEVRGGAPASREFSLLDPACLVRRLDALVLSGGSAFGLAAADGVMDVLAAEGVGFPTSAGPVPIVVGLSLFDLLVGDPAVRPGPVEGAFACRSAAAGPVESGAVGAGAGATVGKWRGRAHARAAGIGSATERHGALVVSALMAVNAFGDVATVPDDVEAGAVGAIAGSIGSVAQALEALDEALASGFDNTTIGVVVTNARLDKLGCHVVAQGGHDGLARAVVPAHTRLDGDALVVAATGAVEAGVDTVRLLAVSAVERAVRAAVPRH